MFEFRDYTQKVNDNRGTADNTLGFEVEPASKIVAVNFDGAPPRSGPLTAVCSGAARGGSSILPYVLQRLGLPMGSFEADNFEDVEMLKSRNSITKLKTVIETRNAENERWGFKITGLRRGQFGFFDEALRAPVFVHIFRNPVLAATSLVEQAHSDRFKADRGGFSNAIQGAVQGYLEFCSFMRQTRSPCILVPMESLREASLDGVSMLSRLLELPADEVLLKDIAEQVRVSGYKSREAV